jgi:hypothetical protein
MSTCLTDLVHQLQDIQAHHSSSEGPVMVEVPTTPYTRGRFEVEGIREDGASVVLSCRLCPEEPAQPRPEEPAQPRTEQRPVCCHNDYEDLV